MNMEQRQPSVRAVIGAPMELAAGIVTEVVATGTAIVMAPARALAVLGSAVTRLQRTLDNLDQMSEGVAIMEREMRGMRADLADVIGELEGVRSGVGSLGITVTTMTDGVAGIRDATETLDSRVVDLNKRLEHIDAVAQRFSRLGVKRKD